METLGLRIGCHLGISDGYTAAAKTAQSIGANTFQYFSRNPMGGSARPVDKKDIADFVEFSKKNGLSGVLAHAPYTLNASSVKPNVREFAKICISGDLETLSLMPGNMFVFHPGSLGGLERDEALGYVVDLLNFVGDKKYNTPVLLEAMSGKGGELGQDFNELATIIKRVNDSGNIGVCIDTCHIFAAGYDIVNNLDGVLEEFNEVIGLKRLKAVHLNDSLMPFCSHKDRHAKIGTGQIGLDAIIRIINHKSLKHLPFYLETPNELDGYCDEIALLRKNYSD